MNDAEIKQVVDFSIVLLHDQMLDKQGKISTTSLTLIDLHDIARSARTYGVHTAYFAHPSSVLRKLARTLKTHWESGFGARYNPARHQALSGIDVVSDLDEAIHKIDLRTGKLPLLVATSAKLGEGRVSFKELRWRIHNEHNQPYLLMLGTGWGMSEKLLNRADLFLEPIVGPGDYNHLSVRSACAIMLDRLLAPYSVSEQSQHKKPQADPVPAKGN
ncbi:MAG: RNA methyltransferase [Candidatus Dadabacteria bacterium]|nr:MAG: RNA methyltransferase [Candidatus Dadabacteria bacterium]